jgi:hypothetical protein
VIGILPGRLATRQRLIIGALVVAFVSIFNLIAVDLGPIFGSPWPIALLWAICGWSKLGANLSTGCLIFVLGCWLDVLTGSSLGTWPCIGLVTLCLTLAANNFLGLGSLSPVASCAVSGFFMLIVMSILSLWQSQQLYFLGSITSIFSAVAIYFAIWEQFELSEDEP